VTQLKAQYCEPGSTIMLPAFAGRVLDVDTAVALRSARLHVPDPRPTCDSFIAGTALVHGMIIVTRNTADFEPMGTNGFDFLAPSRLHTC
jgi:predicted nucleic acid-binding protein